MQGQNDKDWIKEHFYRKDVYNHLPGNKPVRVLVLGKGFSA